MTDRSLLKTTGADFEKAALNRFRSLAGFIPQDCQVYREPWGRSTVVCLNFEACSNRLEVTQTKAPLLLAVAQQLGLSDSIIFKVGNSIKGWTRSQVEKL